MERMGNESTMGWRGWEMRALWDGGWEMRALWDGEDGK